MFVGRANSSSTSHFEKVSTKATKAYLIMSSTFGYVECFFFTGSDLR